MIRIALACSILLFAAPEPAPETTYILRVEEVGGSYTRPALTSLARPRSVPSPDPEEKAIQLFEVDVVPGREFRVKMKHLQETRTLSGSIRPALEGKMDVRIAYSAETMEDGLRGMHSATTNVTLDIGKRVQIGGRKSNTTLTNEKGTFERRSSLGIWVTLLKAQVEN